jgi:enolase
MTTIASVTADWVIDSRATPTLEATVTLSDSSSAFAHAPSGASTGRHESLEKRDGDPTRFGGKGVLRAVEAVRTQIAPHVVGADATDQKSIDQTLVELDGTDDRSHLGANTLLAVSVACARAGAMARGVALWHHLAGDRTATLPLPMVNLFSGGLHARGGMAIQDILVTPFGAPDMATGLEWVCDVYRATFDALTQRGASTLVGDEGGFGAPLRTTDAMLALATEAIERSGHNEDAEVALTIDLAATQLHRVDGRYALDDQILTTSDLIETVTAWIDRYPIVSVEDPLAEDDWEGWTRLAARLDPAVQLVGDDLICTHLDRLERAARSECANAVLVKANQIGTLSEALAVVDRARQLQFRSVVSARSGETEDDWLADLAVASGAGQIKVGSVARSERLSKYNRLLRISRDADTPPWSGPNGLDFDRRAHDFEVGPVPDASR